MKTPWYVKEVKGFSPYNKEMPTVDLKFHWAWVKYQYVKILIQKIYNKEITWKNIFLRYWRIDKLAFIRSYVIRKPQQIGFTYWYYRKGKKVSLYELMKVIKP